MIDYIRDGQEIYRQSFATIRAEADLAHARESHYLRLSVELEVVRQLAQQDDKGFVGPIRSLLEQQTVIVEKEVIQVVQANPEVALQIFHRSFSTKGGYGRGLGTYGMKLLGEGVLGGSVGFESTEEGGTTFWFRLPAAALV